MTFWLAIALKATLWALFTCAAARVIPAHHPMARRMVALIGLWGLWLVPWLPLLPTASISMPENVVAARHAWLPGLVAIWGTVSLGLIAKLIFEMRTICGLVHGARPAALSFPVEVRLSTAVNGPCMTGWWHPCVLLPQEALDWPEQTLTAALRHECQHARQHDGLHRLAAAVMRAVFWWNPALHALCRVYETESEVCCDLSAATACRSRRDYGEMLFAQATGMPQRALAMPFAQRAGLRGRLERLLDMPQSPRWVVSTRWLLAVALLAAGGVLIGSIRTAPLVLETRTALEQEALIRFEAQPFPGSP